MDSHVTALFKDRQLAQDAVEQLVRTGFTRERIRVLMSDEHSGRCFVVTAGSKAPEGALAGGALGGLLGAVIAALAGVGTFSMPDMGVLATGPAVAALAGASALGVAGSLLGGLLGAGIPEHQAKLAGDYLDASVLIGVDSPEEGVDVVKLVLQLFGGEAVSVA